MVFNKYVTFEVGQGIMLGIIEFKYIAGAKTANAVTSEAI